MILKFEDPKGKCGCCPLAPHGYGHVEANEPALTLVPGVNTISKSQLAALENDEIFQHRVEVGIYVINEKITGDSIKGLNPKTAVQLVKETMDRKLLRKWMIDEHRKPVREAIDEQLEKVVPEVKSADDGKGKKK